MEVRGCLVDLQSVFKDCQLGSLHKSTAPDNGLLFVGLFAITFNNRPHLVVLLITSSIRCVILEAGVVWVWDRDKCEVGGVPPRILGALSLQCSSGMFACIWYIICIFVVRALYLHVERVNHSYVYMFVFTCLCLHVCVCFCSCVFWFSLQTSFELLLAVPT